jgi:SAM-dependent methyltransferase
LEINRIFVKLYNKLTLTPFHPQFLYPWFLRRKISSSLNYVEGVLLDVGCGNKSYSPILSKKVTEYIGMDYPPTIQSNPFILDLVDSIDIYGDARKIPLKSSSIDTVVSFQVLGNIPEIETAFSEMARVLKSGGHLIVTTDFLYPVHSKPPVHSKASDFWRLTNYGLEYLAKKNGLKIEKVEESGGFWVTAVVLFNTYLIKDVFRIQDIFLRNKFFYIRLFIFMLMAPVLFIAFPMLNIMGFLLDKIHRAKDYTANYILVARKE